MKGPIPENKVGSILKRSSAKEEWKELMSLWGVLFFICIIGTVFCIGAAIYYLFVNPNYKEAFYAFLIVVFLNTLILVPFYLTSVRGRENYNKVVNSYGREEIRNQLLGEDTAAFYIYADEVSSIIVLTKDYLISPEQFIFPLDQIEQITFTKMILPETTIRARAKDPYMQELMRNEYRMDIFFKNGTKKMKFVAIPISDREALNLELITRCPGCHVYGLAV